MGNKYTNINTNNAVIESLTQFQGFYDNIYRDPFVSGNAFVFLTKPLLFIDPINGNKAENGHTAFLNMTRDPFFAQYLVEETFNSADRKIIELLSYNTEYSSSSFLPVFTNECKRFDITDTTLDMHDSFETKQGLKEVLPTFKTVSEGAGSVAFSVVEDSNLSFTKLISIWVNYISNITDGTFDANPNMILNGELDYVSSIYYFVLAPDGRSIKYWAKFTGCWPTNIPTSGLGYTKGSPDINELNINFQYNIKEEMNPKILEEFNILSLKLTDHPFFYDKKINTLRKEVDGRYSSIKDSPLLNLNEMRKIPNVDIVLKSEFRDPVVVYVPGNNKGVNSDTTDDRFELVFNDRGYHSEFVEEVLENKKYYINDKATNFVKDNYSNFNWDQTDFWLDE